MTTGGGPAGHEAPRLPSLSLAADPRYGPVRALVGDAIDFFDRHPELRAGIPEGPDRDGPGALCRLLLEQLDRPFSLFVCGEFNAGKSSVINALAGSDVAATGVLPTTSAVTPLTKETLVFVDSPGTNSIFKDHQEVTEAYLARADVVLFVTSVERPLSASEASFLGIARGRWGREVVVVLNKADLVTPAERDQIIRFVREGLAPILGGTAPEVFPVSARTGDGIAGLERALAARFGDAERARAKFAAPLATLGRLLAGSSAEAGELRERAAKGLSALGAVVERSAARTAETAALFEPFAARGEAVFRELAVRFGRVVDEHFGLFSLLKAKVTGRPDALRGRIHEVLEAMDFEERIDQVVREAASRLSTSRTLMLADVRDYLAGLDGAPPEALLPPADSRLVDPRKVAEDLKAAAERGMTLFLALGSAAAASGIGAKLSTVAPVEISATVLMVGLGFFTFRSLPVERRKLKDRIEKSFGELGAEFARQLGEAIRKYLGEGVRAVEAGTAPAREALSAELRRSEAAAGEATALAERTSALAAGVAAGVSG